MTGMPPSKLLQPGARFGQFTFTGYTRCTKGSMHGNFRCALCGELRERLVSHVRTGYTKACHCQRKVNMTRHGHAADGIETPTYHAWHAMKGRCLNPTHKNFQDYGGRGITVCDSWLAFDNFLADMGDKPIGKSLDRRDNNKGYFKGNCRWATCGQQNNNKRNNTVFRFNGEAMTIAQWSQRTGIKDCTISERLRQGWSVERALTEPSRKYCHVESVPPALR